MIKLNKDVIQNEDEVVVGHVLRMDLPRQRVAIGMSLCHEEDTYSERIGEQLAELRMAVDLYKQRLAVLTVTKETLHEAINAIEQHRKSEDDRAMRILYLRYYRAMNEESLVREMIADNLEEIEYVIQEAANLDTND